MAAALPRLSSEAYFAGQAAGYRSAERGLWAWQRRREAHALFALAGPVAGRSALDLGCGAGFYARQLVRRGAGPVVAVDAVPRMLAAIDDPRIETLEGDAATVQVGRRFERILLAGVLEFVGDAGAVLVNARRHLAPGGRIVLLVPPDNWAGRLYRRFHAGHGLAIRLFDRDGLAGLAAAAGLTTAAERRVFPYAVVQALEAA